MREVVIVDAVRSAVGKRNGSFAHKPATELLGDVIVGLLDRNDIEPDGIGHVVGGCVQQIGVQSGNVTRNAWLAAGLPLSVPAVTVNTQCGSSQEALTLSHALIAGGLVDVGIACGVETMTAIPMGSAAPAEPDFGQPRGGRYTEHYDPTTQFEGAERIAETWGLTRPELEAFAKRSQDGAARAWAEARFESQIVPVEGPVVDDQGVVIGTKVVDRDEGMRETTLEGSRRAQAEPARPRSGVPHGRHVVADLRRRRRAPPDGGRTRRDSRPAATCTSGRLRARGIGS